MTEKISNTVWRRHAKFCHYRARDASRAAEYPGHWLCIYNVLTCGRCMQRICPFDQEGKTPPMNKKEG